jgi:hypothetical protein
MIGTAIGIVIGSSPAILGRFRPSLINRNLSALRSIADVGPSSRHVCDGPQAEVGTPTAKDVGPPPVPHCRLVGKGLSFYDDVCAFISLVVRLE